MNEIRYRLAQDTIDHEDMDALADWIKTYPQLTKGPLTPKMEQAWAKWVGKKYGVFCNSGSSANLLAAYAYKVSNRLKNNKVVVASTGWVTTLAPFIQFGFDVKMCSSSEDNFGINLEHLETLCKEHNPALVIFVQPLGLLVDKNRLLSLKMKYGFELIEDACAALGSIYEDGTKAGAVGDVSTFSLFFAHQASTIEGGLIFTDDRMLYNILVSLRSHGWLRDMDSDLVDGFVKQNNVDNFNQPFTFILPGFNLRATDLQAFIGLRQVEKIDMFADIRHRNHMAYANYLDDKFQIQKFNPGETISSISFTLLANSKEERKKIIEALVKNGIETRMYSAGALYKHVFYKDYIGDDFSDDVSSKIHECGLFLPNHHKLTINDIVNISNVVLGVAARGR